MSIKQTWVASLVFTLIAVVGTLSFSLLVSPTVHADYAPTNNKCENGTAPTKSPVRGVFTQCDDSTKKSSDQPANNPTPGTTAGTDQLGSGQTPTADDDDEGVTCAIEKVGWILCPIMESAARISDKAFDILADNFLRTDPELVKDDSGTKIAWEVARNLANIMFIISFLIIIFSQVTGRGLNNYGIKKMLPRLIVAAILVNLSYYICQLAVDATNILGYEIQNAMAQIANTVGPSVFGDVSKFSDTQVANTGVLEHPGILFTIVTSVLAIGTVVWFLAPTMVALIPLILITVATIIIILLLRKAFIVLLVVLAPIAFVMYLLPNTEKYFDKWRSMFVQLLLVFPVVSLLFGAGQLASTIILVSGSDNNQAQAARDCDPNNEGNRTEFNSGKSSNDNAICGEPSIVIKGEKAVDTSSGTSVGGCFAGAECRSSKAVTASATTGLVATGIAIAPLLAVWAVLKGALSAAGAIGGKISGAVEKGTRAGVNGGVSAGKKGWEQSAFGRGQAIRKAAKANYKNRKFAENLGDPDDETNPYKKLRKRYTRTAAGGIAGALPENLRVGSLEAQQAAITRSAVAASEKAEHEDVQNAQAVINRETGGQMDAIAEKLEKAIEHGDEVGAKAAQNLLFSMGGSGVDKFIETMGNRTGEVADALARNIRLNHGSIKGTSAGLNEWANNSAPGTSVTQAMGRAGAYSNLSAEQMASQSAGTLAHMSNALNSAIQENSAESIAAANSIMSSAHAAQQSKAYESTKVGNKAVIERIARGNQ